MRADNPNSHLEVALSAPTTSTSTTDLDPFRTLTLDEIVESARGYGSHPDIAAQAAAHLTSGRITFTGLSGKLSSGKDSTAPTVLRLRGVSAATQNSFAQSLKDELDLIFASIRFWGERRAVEARALSDGERWDLAVKLGQAHDFPAQQAFDFFTGPVATEVLTDPSVHARLRTDAVRFALQRLGTDVRRAQDDLYWVKRTIQPTVEVLASGESVYFTDDRFPNEVDSVRALSGLAVRLDVTPQTQRERLFARDGLEANTDALTHISETALDDYPFFDVRLSNDGTPEQTEAALRARLGELGLLREL